MLNFVCDKCGACCKFLNLFGDIYSELDKGNGVCKYLDEENNLCRIYQTRPLICRIDEGYSIYFRNIPYEQYIEETINGCNILKNLSNNKNEKRF